MTTKLVLNLAMGAILASAFGCGSSSDDANYGNDIGTSDFGLTYAANCPAGSNFIAGTPGDDVIVGTAGDDCIFGGGGNDVISGGDGNDTIWGEAGDDTLNGEGGDDNLRGGSGNDTINGGDGNDEVFGMAGDDSVTGGAGDDIVGGNQGNDVVMGEDGDDRCYGHEGDDMVVSGSGADHVWGGSGNDNLNGGDGDDDILGGPGNDQITTGDGNDDSDGQEDCDTIDTSNDPECACTSSDLGSALGQVAAGDTSTTTPDNFNASCTAPAAGDTSYTWMPPHAGTFMFDTFGSDFDTTIAILDGAACNSPEVGCNDQFNGNQSLLSMTFADVRAISLVVDGWGGSFGHFVLNINEVVCGDAILAPVEQCDDGNLVDGDGCSATCQNECGNGVVDGTEECDDGNPFGFDGCDGQCRLEVCGNGILQADEQCDDGNLASGDGCSPTCEIECGNGTVEGAEQCDDGNTFPGDGCDSACMLEVCGNGIVQAGESCDDGNTNGGDGCSATCREEGACPTADLLSVMGPAVASGTTVDAPNMFDPSCAPDGSGEVVYTWTAPFDGTFSFDTVGSDFDTTLFLLGAVCAGDELVCNDDTVGLRSRVLQPLMAGQQISIVVDGYNGAEGAFVLNISEPSCGDTFVDGAEQCDDGNTVDGDGCSATCQNECGDGVVGSNEECDDGNLEPNDGCSPICTIELCGNGTLDEFEQCDDGNHADGDGCDRFCNIEPICGNGVLEPGESCDDGNLIDGDGCESNCRETPMCPTGDLGSAVGASVAAGSTVGLPNGFAPPCITADGSGEATYIWTAPTAGTFVFDTFGSDYDTTLYLLGDVCAGADLGCNDDSSGLQSQLSVTLAAGQTVTIVVDGFGGAEGNYLLNIAEQVPVCGNGVVDAGEECDDGNNLNGDGCSAVCVTEFCGDGTMQGTEQCDDGNNVDGDGCSAACVLESCGDGVVQAPEQCDDGNNVDGDGCSAACVTEFCGDGTMQGAEQCDDGNNVDGDGCSAACVLESCGDGVVQAPEQCDDGNNVDGDGCSAACAIEVCGDGVVQAPEQCDDGNNVDGDGCSAACVTEFCGDGTVQAPEECDDGNNLSGDGCSASCVTEFCGDGIVQAPEECDDGNSVDGDGCESTCTLTPPPVCPDADLLSAMGPAVATGTTEGAPNAFVPSCASDGAGERVFLWTAPSAGEFSFDTVGSDYDTALYALEGTCAGIELACNDDAVGTRSRIVLSLVAGQTISIVVDGFSTNQGNFVLNIAQTACGDGFVDGAEECDDGNTTDFDGCSATCTLECGDGVVGPNEQCDDGNTVDFDGCSAICIIELCGNGTLDAGEQCDDGNFVSGDGCDIFCNVDVAICGDGFVVAPEECDDGNTVDLDGCSSTCVIEQGLDCPTGDLASALGAPVAGGSTATATNSFDPACGGVNTAGDASYLWTAPHDGTFAFDTFGSNFDTIVEVLDGTCGGASVACNDDSAGTQSEVFVSLLSGSQVTVVVDGFGSTTGDYVLNIREVICGDGIVEVTEECDDGNNVDGDGCSAVCVREDICGDGNLTGTEQCDDGNTADGDGCSATCLIEQCLNSDLGSALGAAVATGSNAAEFSNYDPSPACSAGVGGADVVFSWTAPADGSYTFDTTGSDYDTVLYLLNAVCTGDENELACHDDLDFPADVTSAVTITLVTGQVVAIVVDAFGSATGNYVLNINQNP